MEAFLYKPTIGSINSCDSGLLVPSFSTPKKLSFCWKSKKVGIFACKDEAKVNGEDGMGLKLGKVLSDDPKLTLSKEQNSSEDRNVSTSVEDLSVVCDYGHINDSLTGSQPLQQSSLGSSLKTNPSIEESEEKLINASSSTSKEATLHKPTRLNQSVETTSSVLVDKELVSKHTTFGSAELEDLPTSSPINEIEDIDWTTAEDLVKTGQRDEVELISASTRGFVVSFGSLVGFLPYRNLAPKYKYFAFETWLRYKGLDPTMYKQSLSIIGSSENTAKATALYSSLDIQIDQELTSNMELEELLTIYDNEKLRYMSSFLDKGKLSIGEVVKCCITKITYFGIFVEVEGVPAMIHQTEVSWDVSVNPTLCFKIGQIVEAKVHQLDFSLDRIFLSLKEVVPDPLTKTLEAVDHVTQSRESATAEADTEVATPDVFSRDCSEIGNERTGSPNAATFRVPCIIGPMALSGQPGSADVTEIPISEGKTGEMKQRKFQRTKQVLKDRFDEWEEAYIFETEQRKNDEKFMREALIEAKKAADVWEVPVGAVLVQHGKIIARDYNLVEELRDSTAHAEMICIREASNILRSWRLSDTTLYVTLEPCPMCAGAILQARIDTIVWGAPNKLLGADGSWIRLFPNGDEGHSGSETTDKAAAPVHPFHPNIKLRRGVLASECSDIMQQFFQLRRKKKDKQQDKKPDPPTETPPSSCLPISTRPSKLLTKMHNAFHILFCL